MRGGKKHNSEKGKSRQKCPKIGYLPEFRSFVSTTTNCDSEVRSPRTQHNTPVYAPIESHLGGESSSESFIGALMFGTEK